MHGKQSTIRHRMACGFHLSHYTRVLYLMVTVGDQDGTGFISCSPGLYCCGQAVGGRPRVLKPLMHGKKRPFVTDDLWLSVEPLYACDVPDGDGW